MRNRTQWLLVSTHVHQEEHCIMFRVHHTLEQYDVEKMSYVSSPFGSPTHHYHCSPIHHSRESSTSRFSASLKNNQLAVWKRIPGTNNDEDNEAEDENGEHVDYDNNSKSVKFDVVCFSFLLLCCSPYSLSYFGLLVYLTSQKSLLRVWLLKI